MAGTRRIPIFMYHQVLTAAERDQSLHTNPAYTVTVDHFRQQMGCLAETGYRTLTLDAVLESDADLTKAVVITFDDGWEDNWSNALPVMKEFGVRSTVFVVSAFVGMPGYMTWGQLREMAAAGMAIQSHTATHRPLGELSDDEIRLELVTSKKTIEERVGLVVDYVSMPQGVYDHRVVTIAKESGYRAVCTSEPSFTHSMDSIQVLGRINISGRYDLKTFRRLASGNSRALLPSLAVKKGKNLVKGLIGYAAYRKLYDLCYRGRG